MCWLWTFRVIVGLYLVAEKDNRKIPQRILKALSIKIRTNKNRWRRRRILLIKSRISNLLRASSKLDLYLFQSLNVPRVKQCHLGDRIQNENGLKSGRNVEQLLEEELAAVSDLHEKVPLGCLHRWIQKSRQSVTRLRPLELPKLQLQQQLLSKLVDLQLLEPTLLHLDLPSLLPSLNHFETHLMDRSLLEQIGNDLESTAVTQVNSSMYPARTTRRMKKRKRMTMECSYHLTW